MPRQRLSRKELTETDEITSVLERAADFVVDNAKPFVAGIVIVVAAAAGIVGWRVYAARADAVAQTALAEVIASYADAGLQSDDAGYAATVESADRVRTEHAGTRAADMALYYAALAHQGLGDMEASDGILRGLIESGSETLVDNARFALAESYKKRGDLESAIAEYAVLAESPDFSRGAVLYELGRLHEAVERFAEARGYYETLISDHPNSPFRTDADRALRRLLPAEDG